ncbi:MAG: sulfur carrier protein ThiS [Xanthomonadales bacterium]|jgi:sulfur carrier protein|nr:sulfur carrier protein ThiS [Xanthomonadales bacterium]
MRIELNGEARELDVANVAELIAQLGLSGRRVAVELNGEVVPKSRHAVQPLQPGDRVELVHALGGG